MNQSAMHAGMLFEYWLETLGASHYFANCKGENQ